MAETKKNQSEGEFFSLVATGRKGVEDMAAKMGNELQTIAAPNVKGDFSTWMQRAIVEVTANNDLREVIRTREGIYSIYQALAKAATMGLQIGGMFPHAYLVPYGGKSTLQPSQHGFIFACTYGPGAVLAHEPVLMEVYDKDDFVTDGKTVTHKYAPFDHQRGKLVGFYIELQHKDGRHAVRHVTIEEVEAIEKGYGQLSSKLYTKSLIDAHRKTAMKKMLKPIVTICEGLAMLMQLDDYEAMPVREPDMRDVTERASDRLDKATAAIVPADEETPRVGISTDRFRKERNVVTPPAPTTPPLTAHEAPSDDAEIDIF